ncbi:hypothetical protein OGATHE_003005 [Ogataea polymorpha]|uniref:Uncharacterized protein n=1 Tax=Ogataea polymorpha TaxID=460523 RepID=A0A9P8PE53_9ASCO|nr:hypothetical protein OGATHE_003005 [Ogataea polymorpha]
MLDQQRHLVRNILDLRLRVVQKSMLFHQQLFAVFAHFQNWVSSSSGPRKHDCGDIVLELVQSMILEKYPQIRRFEQAVLVLIDKVPDRTEEIVIILAWCLIEQSGQHPQHKNALVVRVFAESALNSVCWDVFGVNRFHVVESLVSFHVEAVVNELVEPDLVVVAFLVQYRVRHESRKRLVEPRIVVAFECYQVAYEHVHHFMDQDVFNHGGDFQHLCGRRRVRSEKMVFEDLDHRPILNSAVTQKRQCNNVKFRNWVLNTKFLHEFRQSRFNGCQRKLGAARLADLRVHT